MENLGLITDETVDTQDLALTDTNQDADVSLDTNQSADVTDDVTIPEIDLGDEKVPYDEVLKAYKDYKSDSDWQASNTQKAQEIAEERRQFDDDRRQFEQRQYEMMQQMDKLQQTQQPQDTFEIPEDFENDPALAEMYKENRELKTEFQKFTENFERQQFLSETQQRHEQLKGKYTDYDAGNIENAIMQGRDQFADVYKAHKYDALMNGDKDSLLNMVPEDVKKGLIQQGKEAMLEELRNKKQMREKVSTPQPTRQALSSIPVDAPKNYRDAGTQAAAFARERGLQLIE